jgi:hypothetical protein
VILCCFGADTNTTSEVEERNRKHPPEWSQHKVEDLSIFSSFQAQLSSPKNSRISQSSQSSQSQSWILIQLTISTHQ